MFQIMCDSGSDFSGTYGCDDAALPYEFGCTRLHMRLCPNESDTERYYYRHTDGFLHPRYPHDGYIQESRMSACSQVTATIAELFYPV